MAVKMKIRSQRGATLMAALLFFLVAAVCGSIILAAATATLSRMTTQAEDARAYYSLTSAAQFMRSDLLQHNWKVVVNQETVDGTLSCSYTINKPVVPDVVASDDRSFVWDLLKINQSLNDSDSVFELTNISITAKQDGHGESLPVVYARPVDIKAKTLYEDYKQGKNTELKFLITNDPYGLTNGVNSPSFRNTFTIDGDSAVQQAYWLELTLKSVKVPSSYVDNTDENENGTIEYEIRWENASIRKLDKNSIPTV